MSTPWNRTINIYFLFSFCSGLQKRIQLNFGFWFGKKIYIIDSLLVYGSRKITVFFLFFSFRFGSLLNKFQHKFQQFFKFLFGNNTNTNFYTFSLTINTF